MPRNVTDPIEAQVRSGSGAAASSLYGEAGAAVANAARLERDAAASLPVAMPDRPLKDGAGRPQRVVLVGAGAVNLIVAWFLREAGHGVTVVDARPDPLSRASWRVMGCTFGGYGARIFSLTEARQHHRRDGSAEGRSPYRTPLIEGGWLACAPELLDARDEAWIDHHECVPGWLLRSYGDDIEAFNVESDPLWTEFRARASTLFEGVSFRRPLIRVYATEAGWTSAAAHEAELSDRAEPLAPALVAEAAPALAEAVEAGELAGGLHVRGFSIDVHAFGRALVTALAQHGVQFRWDCEVEGLDWGADGRVQGLRIGGDRLQADDYVLSPGAYGGRLLEGARSDGLIAAVAGGWVSLPNEGGLATPLKISRRGFGAPGMAEGANAVPVTDDDGAERLHISSGHGYLGFTPGRLADADAEILGRASRETAQRYFPRQAEKLAGLEDSRRICVRPWTATGLGIFETLSAASGGLAVIATGHNTGGFAQAPAIAQAVLAALAGRAHPMHTLYHPDRGATETVRSVSQTAFSLAT